MTLSAVSPGPFPGTDVRRAAELLVSEVGGDHALGLPELPGRGHHASLLGRSLTQLSELYAELTSYGWRLVPRPGADHLRAAQLLSADVDTLADIRGEAVEVHGRSAGALTTTVMGPVSLAARLALPNGEKVLIDHGARRDLAHSLAAGVGDHVAHLRRSCAPSRLRVVLHEARYAAVRGGQVPTVSGYRTIRSLPRDETRSMVGVVVEALRAAGADEVLLDLGEAPQSEHVEDFRGREASRVDGFGLPVPGMGPREWERAAELTDDGVRWLAALLRPGETSRAAMPQVTALARRLTEPWQALGMPTSSLEAFALTSFLGSERDLPSQLGEADALRAVARLQDTAEALTDQLRG